MENFLKLQTFDEYVNESYKTANDGLLITENQDKRNFIVVDKIKSEDDLIKEVAANAGKALEDLFNSKFKIPPISFSTDIQNRRGTKYVSIQSSPLPPKSYGIFAISLNQVTVGNFNGGMIEIREENGQVKIPPYIWYTTSIFYQLINGGTNGTEIIIDGTNSIYYDIVDKKFYSQKDAMKKYYK